MLETTYFGNSVMDWLIGLGVSSAVFLVLKAARRLVVRRLASFARRTANEIDDLVVEILSKTRFFFFAVVAAYVGSSILSLSPGVSRLLDGSLVLGTLLQVALWGNVAIAFLLNRAVGRREDADGVETTTLSALGMVCRLILWSVLLLLALDNLGVNVTGLVAGLGIGGIAVALALQNILGDVFASLSIALDKPFVVGDFIVVDDLLGTVEHIGLKTTRIRSLSGEVIVCANADLLKSRIRNFKHMMERRVVFELGVTYQTPAEKLTRLPSILQEVINAQEGVRFDRAHFKSFGDSSLTFEVVYYVGNSDYTSYMNTQQAVNLEIVRRFQHEGVEFAYPTRTLYVQKTGEYGIGNGHS